MTSGPRHLISIADLPAIEIVQILDHADRYWSLPARQRSLAHSESGPARQRSLAHSESGPARQRSLAHSESGPARQRSLAHSESGPARQRSLAHSESGPARQRSLAHSESGPARQRSLAHSDSGGDEPLKKLTSLRGRTVINLFFENSTRTRTSFELAAKRLSAEAINISSSASSTSKGESLLDTGRNLEAMHPDAIVVRHSYGGAAAMLARTASYAVINAGDGQHEHPTQALLDVATIRRHKGTLEGLEVAIVGDIQHSRVARSNILCLTKLGVRVRLVAPITLMPRGIELIGGDVTRERVRICHRLEQGLDGVDVVMMLRVQHERFEGEASRFPNTRELSRTFGLSERTLAYAKSDAIVMHPGPINRGVEVSPQVADGPRAVILQQVSWGVAIRMAVLERAILGPDVGAAA